MQSSVHSVKQKNSVNILVKVQKFDYQVILGACYM